MHDRCEGVTRDPDKKAYSELFKRKRYTSTSPLPDHEYRRKRVGAEI